MGWRKTKAAVFAVLLGLSAIASGCGGDATELFNGTDLVGWKKLGGDATYAVEEGVIVGRATPKIENTFLATEMEYSDFVLEYEFKIDDRDFNSGVQIRSHSLPEHNGGKAFGYQIEIDPRADRRWTAGLYFEGGSPNRDAVWLNDLSKNPAAQEAFRLGEWNHVKVVADGRRIQTWLNGVPAADFTDEDEKAFAPTGLIALQVHAVGKSNATKEV